MLQSIHEISFKALKVVALFRSEEWATLVHECESGQLDYVFPSRQLGKGIKVRRIKFESHIRPLLI